MQGAELTADRIEQLAALFRRVLGDAWLDACVDRFRRGASIRDFGEAGILIRGFANLDRTLQSMRGGGTPPHYADVTFLGVAASIIDSMLKTINGATAVAKLRPLVEKARPDTFAQFFDGLFEGEVAAYFSRGLPQSAVRFELGSHPDLWLTAGAEGEEFAVECKRASRIGDIRQRSRQLRRNLKEALDQIELSAALGRPGIAAIRMRPPTSKQELITIDHFVRGDLHKNPRPLIGFVELMWEDTEVVYGPWLLSIAGQPQRTATVAYHLRPHRILNANSARQISPHDSLATLLSATGATA